MKKRQVTNQDECTSAKRKNDLLSSDKDVKKQIRFRPKDTPGVICIERHTHDESIVVSGSLVIENNAEGLDAWIEEEIEIAAREIRNRGGVVGQIKAALTVTSTSIMTVSDEKAMERESPKDHVRIMLSAIVSMVDPKEAEDIVRKSLAGIRARLREKNHGGAK